VFQADAFQNDAFQIVAGVVAPVQPVEENDFGFGLPKQIRLLNAQAPGDLLVVTVRLIAGAASSSAKEYGRRLTRSVALESGLASVSVEVAPAQIIFKAHISPGAAKGFDAVKHDNDFFLMAA
jgi:hypothetical protein